MISVGIPNSDEISIPPWIADDFSFRADRSFIGQNFVDGVLGKDITLVMGVVLVYSTLMVVFNLAVDVLYRFVDPRIA